MGWKQGGRDEPVDIPHEGIVLDEDQYKSILFKIEGDDVWLPRTEIVEHDDDTVTIPLWLAEDRDLDPG
ncbi:hypothetical protein LCGC14_1296820 [marine sediment metagenome]|uniref:Uncharacterized protein n=1 Tax=marine sediment metagenome TaxID=412755 RepID=A0A0F9KR17_9ZZZZ